MLLHFGYQRTAPVALDFDALIDRRQTPRRKSHIDDRAVNRADPP